MAILEILQYPDARLNTPAQRVEKIDATTRKLIDDMVDTMYATPREELAESVTVTALDLNGSRFTLNASGMLAACIQHEMDHLRGKVFIDYLSELKQNRVRAKLKKRQRKAA